MLVEGEDLVRVQVYGWAVRVWLTGRDLTDIPAKTKVETCMWGCECVWEILKGPRLIQEMVLDWSWWKESQEQSF